VGRAGSGAAGAGAALALFIVWLPVRSTQELNLGALGFGSSFALRVDGVAFAFALIVVLPATVLLALQRRSWREAAIATLGLSAALAAIEAGGIVLTALAGGAVAVLAAVQLDSEDDRSPRARWSVLLAAWLVLSLAGVLLQVRGGTAAYEAVPVASFTGPIFALLAVAAVLASGLVPWRSWPGQVWTRPSSRAAGMAVATLYPLGFYLLVRAYEMGDGRYPVAAFQVALAILGVLIALGAAARAQGAETQREFLAEIIPAFGGFALMTLALGTPLGLAAALITLATGALLAAAVSLLPGTTGPHALLAIAAAVGLPPGLAFGARVLGIEATFEGGDLLGLIGLAGAASWAVWMVAAARALGLKPGRSSMPGESFPVVASAISALTMAAGPALPALMTIFADPAQADVMGTPAGAAGGGLISVETVSTVLPALTLFAPLLAIGIVAYLIAGARIAVGGPRPATFAMPYASLMDRVRVAIQGAAVPQEYRSLANLRLIETAVAGGRPVLWLAALASLAFAVTR